MWRLPSRTAEDRNVGPNIASTYFETRRSPTRTAEDHNQVDGYLLGALIRVRPYGTTKNRNMIGIANTGVGRTPGVHSLGRPRIATAISARGTTRCAPLAVALQSDRGSQRRRGTTVRKDQAKLAVDLRATGDRNAVLWGKGANGKSVTVVPPGRPRIATVRPGRRSHRESAMAVGLRGDRGSQPHAAAARDRLGYVAGSRSSGRPRIATTWKPLAATSGRTLAVAFLGDRGAKRLGPGFHRLDGAGDGRPPERPRIATS